MTVVRTISSQKLDFQPNLPYPAVLKTFLINQKQVQLWVPEQSDDIIESYMQKDPDLQGHIPYWSILWPSAFALADFCYRHHSLIKEEISLEIGCGLGLAGIAASQMGAEVIYSDFDESALAFAKENHALNFSGMPGWTQQIDWFNPPSQKYDLILGSDVVYEANQVEAIQKTFKKCLSSRGKAWLTEPNRSHAQSWMKALEGEGIGSKVFLEEVDFDGKLHDVWIYEFYWEQT